MKNSNLIIVILLFLISCKKENEYDFPLIQTGEVTDIDSSGAVFHAKIVDKGSGDVLEYGFIWGFNKSIDINSSKSVIAASPHNDVISIRVSYDLINDSLYYVRAFVRNANYITYGRVVSFQSMGSMPPSILDFSPKEGSGGTQVTITGKNFSSSLSGNIVTFGKANVTVVQASNTQLIVKIPDDVDVSGLVKIKIETAYRAVSSNTGFRLLGSNIIDFLPKILIGGDIIHIHAEDYGESISENQVKIGGITSEILEINQDTIFAIVPFNCKLGTNEVSLSVNNKTCYTNDSVIVKSPWSSSNTNCEFYRSGSIGFSIGETGYVGLGVNIRSNMLYEGFKDLWKYNIHDGSWVPCTDLPGTERENAVSFSIGEKGYVCLGSFSGGIWSKNLYEYDSANNTWTKKSDFPGNWTGGSAFCSVVGNKAYVGLANDTYNDYTDFWAYYPLTDKWTKLANFPAVGGYRRVGFALNNKLYIGLGNNINDGAFSAKEFWQYDPSTNHWSRLADFPGKARIRAVGFSLGGYGYIGMGILLDGNYDTVLDDFWRYDATHDKWTRLADLPYKGRWEAVSFIVDNKGYICSGCNDDDDYGFHAESLIVFNPNISSK